MRFLQQEGFTLGVHDILTVKRADRRRREIIKECRKIGKEAVTKALDVPIDTPDDEVVEKIEELVVTDAKIRTVIDRQYKSGLDSFTNEINRYECLQPYILCLPFLCIPKRPFKESNMAAGKHTKFVYIIVEFYMVTS